MVAFWRPGHWGCTARFCGGSPLYNSIRLYLAACLAAGLACVSIPAIAAPPDTPARPNLHDQLDALFTKHAYPKKGTQLAWQKDGEIYTILEPAAGGKGMDIVAYDTASGKRSVLISAAQLTPKDAKAPLDIDQYSWSDDRKKLLIFTNTKKVWRQNTRGDYWVFDEAAGSLKKLGGDAPESTLMFATFSPDSTRVAYVRANNLYI